MPTLQNPSTLVVTLSDKDEGDGNKGKEDSHSPILSIAHEENKHDKEEEETKGNDEAEHQQEAIHILITLSSVTP